MVYLFLGESGAHPVRPDIWDAALRAARIHGWEPRGTFREPGWRGSSTNPRGQLVAARDAASLALALEDALDDVPDVGPPEGGAPPASVFERLAGSTKAEVVRLVAFLQAGPFMIYASCGRTPR